jgi:DnaJ family protein C protein 19
MTRREASLILGVSEFATEPEIGKAYKKVMMLNHPDRGGSLFLATKINQAKDTLLVK